MAGRALVALLQRAQVVCAAALLNGCKIAQQQELASAVTGVQLLQLRRRVWCLSAPAYLFPELWLNSCCGGLRVGHVTQPHTGQQQTSRSRVVVQLCMAGTGKCRWASRPYGP